MWRLPYRAIGWSVATFVILGLLVLAGLGAYVIWIRAYNGQAAYEELIRVEQKLVRDGVLKNP